MISETKFEVQYSQAIIRLSEDEGISFSSALEDLFSEFKSIEGDEVKFNQLLIGSGLKNI